MAHWVTLSAREWQLAENHAEYRQIQSRAHGMRPKAQQKDDDTAEDGALGALGEMAFARFANAYWSAVESKEAEDVGFRWEVRTRRVHSWDLIVRPGDSLERPYVLVTADNAPGERNFCIRGWINGEDTQNREWLRTRTPGRDPCYFVPQSALTAFDERFPFPQSLIEMYAQQHRIAGTYGEPNLKARREWRNT